MRRYEQHGLEKPDPTIVNPAHLDHERSSMVCGQCHGIHWISDSRDYYFNGFRYRPGGRLIGTKNPFEQPDQGAAEVSGRQAAASISCRPLLAGWHGE